MKSNILDPKWKYVPAAETSVAKTFARIRRDQKAADERAAAEAHQRIIRTVTPFGRR